MLALAYRNPVAVKPLPQILCISSYPPRECGIATYSQDLLRALSDKFSERFSVKVCALETGESIENYPEEVKFKLNTDTPEAFERMAQQINADPEISYVLIQHEFGFFQKAGDAAFLSLLYALSRPITLVFHTVLPEPDAALTQRVKAIEQERTLLEPLRQVAERYLAAGQDEHLHAVLVKAVEALREAESSSDGDAHRAFGLGG